jgi:hypothetical protein
VFDVWAFLYELCIIVYGLCAMCVLFVYYVCIVVCYLSIRWALWVYDLRIVCVLSVN